MDPFIHKIQSINNLNDAIELLNAEANITPKLQEIIDFTIEAHQGQFRKSGEPYAVHPILVASVASHFSNEEDTIATALLHDVVEDTKYNLDYIKERWGGEEVAHMVDGLTKIDEIREHELVPSNSNKKTFIFCYDF